MPMNKQMNALLEVLRQLLLRKIMQETGYFALGYGGKMRFQSYEEWLTFQRRYGEISSN